MRVFPDPSGALGRVPSLVSRSSCSVDRRTIGRARRSRSISARRPPYEARPSSELSSSFDQARSILLAAFSDRRPAFRAPAGFSGRFKSLQRLVEAPVLGLSFGKDAIGLGLERHLQFAEPAKPRCRREQCGPSSPSLFFRSSPLRRSVSASRPNARRNTSRDTPPSNPLSASSGRTASELSVRTGRFFRLQNSKCSPLRAHSAAPIRISFPE